MDWSRDPLAPNRSLPEQDTQEMTTISIGEAEGPDTNWVPIVDYAVRHGMSTSTIRRYIKAGKIQYKLVEGRYLIYSESVSEIENLQKELAKAQEQIAELKMLVALYEEKLFSKNN